MWFWIGVLIFFAVIGVVWGIQDTKYFKHSPMGIIYDHMKNEQNEIIDFAADGMVNCEHDGEYGHECTEEVTEDGSQLIYTCKHCGKSIKIINFKKVNEILNKID